MRYGYDRVSSKTQSFDGQVEQLEAAGCTRIFREKASAKDADRPQFKRLMKTVQAGDVIVVCKLDRLCRSSRDLFNTLHQLAEVGCGFTSLGENWCDTESDVGRLLIAVMSGVSEFERSMIKSRTEAGIARARKKGTQFGRPKALDDGQKRKIAEQHADGETIEALAQEYEVGVGTIWRALH